MLRDFTIYKYILVLYFLSFTTIFAQKTEDLSTTEGDSLTDEDLISDVQTKNIAALPIIFDSIKTTDFFPYMHPEKISFKKKIQNSLPENNFEKKYDEKKLTDKIRRRCVNSISLSNPELIEYYNLNNYDPSIETAQYENREIILAGLDTLRTKTDFNGPINIKSSKVETPWFFGGNLSLQFSQYYVTDNWYKGGTPNATFLSIFAYNINYQKKRILWENDFDVKIGFYNTSEDTIRAFRVNNDVFKISTRFGFQTKVSKKLYYSAGIDFSTSLFTGYKKTNSNEVVTAFISPTRTFFSLGMDYRHNKKTSVRISPFAYKIITLTDDRIDPLSVGLDSTQSSTSYPGYMIQAMLNWKFSREILITSDFEFFSSYDCQNIEFDWETVGKFIINRYLSTRLSLIMRFDNTPKNEEAKIQIQEQLSFGFSYTFQ